MSDVKAVITGPFTDANGKPSLMRIGVFSVLCLGGLVVLAGLVGWLFLHLDNAVAVMGIGAAMIPLALGAKAWQSGNETVSLTQGGSTVSAGSTIFSPSGMIGGGILPLSQQGGPNVNTSGHTI